MEQKAIRDYERAAFSGICYAGRTHATSSQANPRLNAASPIARIKRGLNEWGGTSDRAPPGDLRHNFGGDN